MVEVFVNDDIDKALRRLKRKLSDDGDQRRLRERKRFTPVKERKRKKTARAARKKNSR